MWKWVLAGVAAAIAAGLVLLSSQDNRAHSQRPNVLVFVTDDQRARGTLQVMPNVRKWFAARGTTFVNAFATTPLCCPSRATIFSGRYAHNHGVRLNHLSHRLDLSTTVQHELRRAGYRTAIAGKFLNQWGTEQPPPDFDRWAIFLEGEYHDRQWNLDGDIRRLPTYTNTVVREKAIEFLNDFEENADTAPWFLYVGTNAAHAPFTPEPRYERVLPGRLDPNPAMQESDLSDKPELRETSGRRPYVRRNQLRTLMSADDTVGRIFDELAATGELENTLAIFLSDNGMQWGEHGYTGKRLPFDPSVRVPLIVRRPGIAESLESDRLVGNVDVAATILAEAGVGDRSGMDGRPMFGGQERNELLLEHWHDAGTSVPDWASIVSRSSQYIEYYASDGSVRWRAFYDRADDPWQLRNLFADGDKSNDPPAALRRRLARYRSCVSVQCP